jgi:hypothetical protein
VRVLFHIIFAASVSCFASEAWSQDVKYGLLDFGWLNKKEESLFFSRLQTLAMEEAFLLRGPKCNPLLCNEGSLGQS